MAIYLDAFKQCFFIPAPTLTADNLPDQAGRVFIVTGGYAGCGKELCKILYRRNGIVYVAGRSRDKADKAIQEIKAAHPSSAGQLHYLALDLGDLPSVRKAAEDFLGREQRLDVLTNNAGVMMPPPGSKTAQHHELQMGTNCLGPWLFTELLTPLLEKTAKSSPKGAVRVTWAASLAVVGSPPDGVAWDAATDGPKTHGVPGTDYAQSKAGNVLLSKGFAAHHPFATTGIATTAWNPGNLTSELHRHLTGVQALFVRWICHPVHLGGLTELWAGWSEEAGKEENAGRLIGPWGRFVALRGDVKEGKAVEKLWEWCERETKEYRA